MPSTGWVRRSIPPPLGPSVHDAQELGQRPVLAQNESNLYATPDVLSLSPTIRLDTLGQTTYIHVWRALASRRGNTVDNAGLFQGCSKASDIGHFPLQARTSLLFATTSGILGVSPVLSGPLDGFGAK